MVTISITSQQNVCEEKKVIEQFQLFIFGTEVLISLISSLGGWWGCGWVVFLAKGTTSRTLVFLILDKKGTSKFTKMAILRKKGTLGSQRQSLINSPSKKQNIFKSGKCPLPIQQVPSFYPQQAECLNVQITALNFVNFTKLNIEFFADRTIFKYQEYLPGRLSTLAPWASRGSAI